MKAIRAIVIAFGDKYFFTVAAQSNLHRVTG
jgi:hypothetical protein